MISPARWVVAVAVLTAASVSEGASLIVTTTAPNAMPSASKYVTHWTSGHYWVAVRDGSQLVLFSSWDGVVWSPQGAVFTFYPADFEWAVRYSGDTIVAFGYRAADSQRYYRKGTLLGDGSILWNAPEVPAGVGGASDQQLNAAIINGRPVMWRAGPANTDAGSLTVGSQLDAPVWSDYAAPALSSTTSGGFSAGAVLPLGGSDPNDLVILRTTTASVYSAGSHRLVSVKFDASAGSFDSAWYDVSTLGALLVEDATTEVRVMLDDSAHMRFAAVRDTNGVLNAIYVNRNSRAVHYKKDPGMNDTWSRVSTDVTGAGTTSKVGLSAVEGGNLLLYYEKGDKRIWTRRFDGTTWGPESLVHDSGGTDINDSLGPMELAVGCSSGLAFSEGIAPPVNVLFTLGGGTCSDLQAAEALGSITVTAPAKFEMRFDVQTGGGLGRFYDLETDPSRLYDLAGGTAEHNALLYDEIESGGQWFNTEQNAPGMRLHLIEATSTRVKLRQDALYQHESGAPSILAGLRATGDYSVYPSGKMALRWTRESTSNVNANAQGLGLVVHSASTPPLSAWTAYSESGVGFPSPPIDDFLLFQIEEAEARTDFLHILSQDWSAADVTDVFANPANEYRGATWQKQTPATILANTQETWRFVTYFKPTDFFGEVDSQVTSRRTDYRSPDSLSVLTGAPWLDPTENTSGGDDFNESEAAYVLTFDPVIGLRFDIDGSAAVRYSPFFKIRGWHSLGGPQVALEGVGLASGIDFKADVKPVSRAYLAHSLLWHSTLQDLAALDTLPDVGTAGAFSGTVSFVPARYGNGAETPDSTSYIRFPTAGNFAPARGAIEFWYKPAYPSDDGVSHALGGYDFNGANNWLFEKDNINGLRFRIVSLGNVSEIVAAAGSYGWRANEWVHLRFEWDDALPVPTQLKIFVNGVEPNPGGSTGLYLAASNVSANFQIGRRTPQAGSPGIYDEIRVYGGTSSTPARIAHGGLTASPEEYLADAARNFTIDLDPLDGARRGNYLYFGADSKFRGLNVELATPGSGLVDLQWEYWDDTGWANLEAAFGFVDQTSHLSQSGTVYWTGDPFNWTEYSVDGGPELFFVRARVASGAYTSYPVERLIKTDILLFQYCANVTAAAQRFDFAVPVPIAGGAQIASSANQSFPVGSAPTPAAGITILDDVGSITAGNDIRIRIPIGFPMRWNTSMNSLVLGGSASSKVDPTVAFFEDGEKTLVLDVWIDFAPGDWLTVDGVGFVSFTAPAPLSNLELEAGNDGVVSDFDDKTITIVAGATAVLSSDRDQQFTVGDPPTLSRPITVTDGTTASISPGTNIRIRIPSTFDMTWDPFEDMATLSGPAAAKVNLLVAFEDANRTAVLTVNAPFDPGEHVLIEGLFFANFLSASPTDRLELEVGNDDIVTDEDDKRITVLVSGKVQVFTATSTSTQNRLQWVNPPGAYDHTRILARDDGVFPTDPYDLGIARLVRDDFGTAGAMGTWDDVGLTNGTTYSYTAFVHDGTDYSAGVEVEARPFDNSGNVKWAYSTGAASMAPPGLRFEGAAAFVYAVSNDSIVHAMVGSPSGGDWPANWKPFRLGEPAQSRPPVLPFPVGSAAKGVALLGSQDGQVYAVDAETGALEWQSPPLGERIQGAPGGIWSAYAGSFDRVLVGTRNSTPPNLFHALDPFASGGIVWTFDNSVLQGGDGSTIGIISGGPSVSYADVGLGRRLLYFTSHAAGSPDTVWCLRFDATSVSLEWASDLPGVTNGTDVEGSPVLFNNRVYVGTTGGEVVALDAANGAVQWVFDANDGAIKGFLFPRYGTMELFFATTNKVWLLRDDGAGYTVLAGWPVSTIPYPSTPLFVPGSNHVVVGGADGYLYQMVAGSPLPAKRIQLGDGGAAIGAPSMNLLDSMIYVGTDEGVVYGIRYPLP